MLNNPITNTNPLGLWSWKTAGIGAIQIVAAAGSVASATLVTVASAAGGPVTCPAGVGSAILFVNDASKNLRAGWTNIIEGQDEWVAKEDYVTPLDSLIDANPGLGLLEDAVNVVGVLWYGHRTYHYYDV